MVRVLLPLALLLIAFWVYSIVDCALLDPTRHRGVSKPVWLLIVILLPVVGGVLWFIVGRGRVPKASSVKAPDDDPAFLGRIGSVSDVDDRIRRLEAELAALDAEESPQPGPAASASPADADATDPTDSAATGSPAPGSPAPEDDADPRGTRG